MSEAMDKRRQRNRQRARQLLKYTYETSLHGHYGDFQTGKDFLARRKALLEIERTAGLLLESYYTASWAEYLQRRASRREAFFR